MQTSQWLTQEENSVLELLAQGHSNAEIANRLAISPNHASLVASHVLEKVGVENIDELIRRVEEMGGLSPFVASEQAQLKARLGQEQKARRTKLIIKLAVIVGLLIAAVATYVVLYEMPALTYWDGNTHPGRPIVDSYGRISRAAHIAFRACGLGDAEIIQLRESRGGDITTTYYDSSGKPRAVTQWVQAYGNAAEVSCKKLDPK